jgi:signal transduction histidine kinase/CheY-like chemotaxis protein
MTAKNLFWNILLSGKTFENEETGLNSLFIRYFFMNLALVSGFCILLFFSVESILQKSHIDTALNVSMAFLCLVSFLVARTAVKPEVPVFIAVLGYPVFCAGLVLNGAAGGVGFVWMYMYPLLATILAGMKSGIFLSLFMITPVSLIVLIPGLSGYRYEFPAALRLIVSYFLVMGLTIVLEFARAAKEKTNLELTRSLKAQRDEIAVLKEKADAASEAKSNFLASMSHEIRTPMNAVIGMTELLLRQDLDRKARENLSTIKQAGTNLLSIINDILDFSKIEAGKLEIMEEEYFFASLINDIINIIRVRTGEKPLRFITMIDGKLPAKLFGDEIRVRQILLNLLTNAVKYTRKGNITLSARGERIETPPGGEGSPPVFMLRFEVRDTGIGIRAEDMANLFENFIQFDGKRNRDIEGTGLGLTISRNLCRLMGGSLTAESVYGEGSVFVAEIPQKVLDGRPFAPVENRENKNCLVYEERKTFAMSITYTLESLGVPAALARNKDELVRELKSGRYQFAFVAWPVAEEVQLILKEKAGTVTVVAMAEYGKKIPPGCRELYMPTQPTMVANILNGKNTGFGFQDAELPDIRFTAPEARVLVVDDIASNIDVVSGLLAPYKMIVDKAESGGESVEMVKRQGYDLVLMDHMMPGMDGIEAAAAIRAWEAEKQPGENPPGVSEIPRGLPIIALTANAIAGMREMFLEKGFNDYLSKPIEIAKLDDIMARWIPREKQIKTGRGLKRETFSGKTGILIPGVDVQKGISMTGGTEARYRKVLVQFCKDARERLVWLKNISGEKGPDGKPGWMDSAQNLSAFIIHVHALKGTAGTIGAAKVSEEAAALEAAGKAGDGAVIQERLPGFCGQLLGLIERVGSVLEEDHGGAGEKKDLAVLLPALRAALEAKNMKETDRLLEELEAAADKKTREGINAVSDRVLMGEYREAAGEIDRLIDRVAAKLTVSGA